MDKNENKNLPSGLSKFNFVLIVILGIVFLINEGNQEQRNKYLVESIGLINTVDYTDSNIQDLSNGFLLGDAAQKEHLTGIKFSGRILNTQSVIHTNITFEITVGGKSKKFVITKISPGNSTGFNVYVPDIKVENARYAEIRYISSIVRFIKG